MISVSARKPAALANYCVRSLSSCSPRGQDAVDDEIGLGWMVEADKGHFNGCRAMLAARKAGKLRHVLVGLES